MSAPQEPVPESELLPAPVVDEDIDALKKKLPPGLRPYKRLDMPTAEQIMSEDFMNNCAVRTVLSGVMGAGLGVMFGLFMGTMDGAVRAWVPCGMIVPSVGEPGGTARVSYPIPLTRLPLV